MPQYRARTLHALPAELALAYNITAVALANGYEAVVEKSFEADGGASTGGRGPSDADGSFSLKLSEGLLKRSAEERRAELREREVLRPYQENQE